MERKEALRKVQLIVGKDLVKLAADYDIQIHYLRDDGKPVKQKGWAGHVIERVLGLPLNTSQSPNFGSWELKLVSLKQLKTGKLTFKETMAITMIDPYQVVETPFEESHLLSKLQKILIAARIWENKEETSSILYSVQTFNLDAPEMYQIVKNDYELVRTTIRERGLEALSGKMGQYIQPRTKGKGHGSKTRAFYARKDFLKLFVKIDQPFS